MPARRKQTVITPAAERGFTLVELLVVIAVIGVLAALLIPGLSRAKESGKSTACKSNLRQIGIALKLYVEDFGSYPMGWYGGVLSGYTSSNLFRCPSARVPDEQERLNDPNAPWWNYGYNHRGTGFSGGGREDLGLAHGRNESVVLFPSDMVAVGDALDAYVHPYILKNGGFLNSPFGLQARHNQGANAVFCDGHVECDKVSNWLKATDIRRQRWNCDNQPHPETWDGL